MLNNPSDGPGRPLKLLSPVSWVLSVFVLNGFASFAYVASMPGKQKTFWAMLAVMYVFLSGVTQTGIVFSAIMKLVKARWSGYLCKMGEILTLSFFPVLVVTFLIIYTKGLSHLFYWASAQRNENKPLNFFLNKDLFFWKNILSMSLFYFLSYLYFKRNLKAEQTSSLDDYGQTGSNFLPAFVIMTYVIANTNTSWDFGMTLIPRWESSIFPLYYCAGNLLAGSAFLFLMSGVFVVLWKKRKIGIKEIDPMGKLLLGFTLLWVYMFWSQFVRIWYGNLPYLTQPLIKRALQQNLWVNKGK